MFNKNFKSKNPNFVEDLKRLDKLSKEDAFINNLISSIVFTLNNEENKKIKHKEIQNLLEFLEFYR